MNVQLFFFQIVLRDAAPESDCIFNEHLDSNMRSGSIYTAAVASRFDPLTSSSSSPSPPPNTSGSPDPHVLLPVHSASAVRSQRITTIGRYRVKVKGAFMRFNTAPYCTATAILSRHLSVTEGSGETRLVV
ncbi:hypothetical protein J6590_048022 [Homalodisca vitripennis]|nr:hypothetical protein J6590_048022 [Homalodisca vitripennis]